MEGEEKNQVCFKCWISANYELLQFYICASEKSIEMSPFSVSIITNAAARSLSISLPSISAAVGQLALAP